MPSTNVTSSKVRSVLLVDDAQDMRALIGFVLDGSPRYRVVGEAGDGAAGIDQCRALDPDLVLLDLSMPGMDGLEALPHLMELGADVVVLSGYAKEAMAEKAVALGALGYIEKGGRPDAVLAALDAILGTTPPVELVVPPVPFAGDGLARSLSGLRRQLARLLEGHGGEDAPGTARLRQLITGLDEAMRLRERLDRLSATTSFDLDALVEQAIEHAGGDQAHRITVVGEAGTCVAHHDASRRILVEVFRNALQHGSGPRVEVTLEDTRVRVHNRVDHQLPGKLSELFLPFVTVEDNPRAGVGMGLAVAAELARLSRVGLGVEPGEGLTMVLDFPTA